MLVEDPKKKTKPTDNLLELGKGQSSPMQYKMAGLDPKEESEQWIKAPLWKRQVSLLINLVLAFLFVQLWELLVFIGSQIYFVLPYWVINSERSIGIVLFFVLQLLFIFRNGQTLGKKIIGLYVVQTDTLQTLNGINYIAREIDQYLNFLNFFNLSTLLLAIFGKPPQGKLKTLVVIKKAS